MLRSRPLAALTVLSAAGPALAQCNPEWIPEATGPANGEVHVLGSYQGDLVAGGSFTLFDGVAADRLARRVGNSWTSIGPPGAFGPNSSVYALLEHQGSLIVGGQFVLETTQGQASHIARWDGAAWNRMGTNLGAAVYDLIDYNGQLIAAGAFGLISPGPKAVVRWTGTTWQSLSALPVDGPAATLTAFDGDLVVAGAFWQIGGVTARGIARWDGVVFSPMGLGLTNQLFSVLDVTAFNGDLYATGTFGHYHPAVSSIAQWADGQKWVQVGSGLHEPPDASALAVYRDQLIVAGAFAIAGGLTLPGIAAWSGQAWSALGPPAVDHPTVLRVHDGDLWTNGPMAVGGGASKLSRWGCLCYADCTNDGAATVADFGCFQSQFVLQHPYADCNSDGAHTVADFGCFQTRFVLGCP